jgi:hypothetical protein
MPEEKYISPKILKITFLVVFAFFLLVIIFTLWMRTTLEEITGTRTIRPPITKPKEIERSHSIRDSKVSNTKTKNIIREPQKAPGKEEILLLQ